MQRAPAHAAPQPVIDAFARPAADGPTCDNLEFALRAWSDPTPFFHHGPADPWLGPAPSEFQSVPVALCTAGLIAVFARGPESDVP